MSPRAIRRVLMTVDTVGGGFTTALDLAEALAPYGIEVTLVTTGGLPSRPQTARADGIPNLRLIPLDRKAEWMDRPESDLEAVDDALREIVGRVLPDIVHVFGFAHAAAGFAAPVVVAAHRSVPTWWRAAHGEPAPQAWNLYRDRVDAGLRAAAAIVAPTHAFLAAFVAEHGAARMSRVIHVGRDPARFAVGEKAPHVLAVGDAEDGGKNIEALDRAARHMRHPILVAGGSGSENLPHLFALGRLDPAALAEKMAEAAVYVSTARYAPFGLAALEAAHSGAALVLADNPTFRELWEGAARFVHPDDDRALAAAMEELLADPERARRAGEAARRRAQRYTAEAMAASTVRLWRGLLLARSAGRAPLNRPAAMA